MNSHYILLVFFSFFRVPPSDVIERISTELCYSSEARQIWKGPSNFGGFLHLKTGVQKLLL